MNNLERRTLLGAAGIGAIAALSKAGPLDPPAGSVAPTGRTLDELYAKIPADGRTAITGGTFTGGGTGLVITQPGSYILTGDIAGGDGAQIVLISAARVTLDLNGFSIRSLGGLGIGIQLGGFSSIVVRNGRVFNCATGISTSSGSAGTVFEDLDIVLSKSVGINSLGHSATIRRCKVADSGGNIDAVTGIVLNGDCGVLDQCVVSRFVAPNTSVTGMSIGGNGHIVTRCTVGAAASTTGTGMLFNGQIAYRDNTVVNFTTPYSAGGGAGSGGGNV